jgi:hypothetical protein
LRGERFFPGCFDHGASDDGGREEFDESGASRRFNPEISSACPATMRSGYALRAVSSATCLLSRSTSPNSCS